MFLSRDEVRPSYVSKGFRFVGDVRGEGTLMCEGEIEGTIEVDGLVQILPGGKVRGCVRASEAEIAGTVEGDVATRGRLKLQATCRVEGDVVTPNLVVEPGAILQGQVNAATERAEGALEPQVRALPSPLTDPGFPADIRVKDHASFP